MPIQSVRTDHYRIPLPVVLSDSTHGEIPAFELIAVRVEDEDGIEGVGYTYTVGRGGAAIRELIGRDMAPDLVGQEAARVEALWNMLWWRVHYVGRGGLTVHALSAVDIALWDLKAKQVGEPLWRLLGGSDPDGHWGNPPRPAQD